jgi:hypothetical protein
MSFPCSKCNKVFKRNIDLNRHINRKIPCDRKLECNRCFKIFNQKCDLLNHINKKNKCYNRRSEAEIQDSIKTKSLAEIEMQLVIESEKTKQLNLQIEIEKLKNENLDKELKLAPKKIPNINIYNCIFNIGDFKEIRMNVSDIERLISEQDSKNDIIQKLSKFMFNNKAYPDNQCLGSFQGNVWGKINGKFQQYIDIAPHINILFRKQCNEISRSLEDNEKRLIQNKKKLSKDLVYKNKLIKDIPEYINNESEKIIEPSLKKL